VLRFCVKTEKRPKQYINRQKSTFAAKNLKNLKLLHGPIFPILWEKYFFSSKTSSDRLKLLYKTKKKFKKNNYVKSRTTVQGQEWLPKNFGGGVKFFLGGCPPPVLPVCPCMLSAHFNRGRKGHYCLVSLMWMKIGSNDITAQVPGVS
jgi:hypothetical protein